MEIEVTESVANFFYQQCVKTFPGHMANVPNIPVLYSLFKSHKVDTEADFVRFLRRVIEQLEKEQPF